MFQIQNYDLDQQNCWQNRDFWSQRPKQFVLFAISFCLGTSFSLYQISFILLDLIYISLFCINCIFTPKNKFFVCFCIIIFGLIANLGYIRGQNNLENFQATKSKKQYKFFHTSKLPNNTKKVQGDKSQSFTNLSWANEIYQFHKSQIGLEKGTLLTSMILGNRAIEAPKTLTENFRSIGLAHILAASGFNLSIATGSIFIFSKLFCPVKYIRCIFSFIGILGFLFLAGESPSIIRASLMCTMVLIATSLNRNLYMPAALALSLLVTCIYDPCTISDIGFQLSYISTATLIIYSSLKTNILHSNTNNIYAKIKYWLKESVISTLAVEISILPLQIYYFKQFSTLFLISNLAILPLVPLITIIGFTSTIFFIITKFFGTSYLLCIFLDKLLELPLNLIIFVVDFFASFPFASINTKKISSSQVLLSYFLIAISFTLKFRNRDRNKDGFYSLCTYLFSLLTLIF